MFAAVTDVRGVATLPAGAAVLAWDGESVAFSSLDLAPPGVAVGQGPVDATSPLRSLDQRLSDSSAGNDQRWSDAVTRTSGHVRLGR